MGLKDNLMRFIVIGSLVTAVVFGFWVASSCEYLEASLGDLRVGVYRYSLDLAGDFDTGGNCVKYGQKASYTAARTAQVCAGIAPAFGILLVILICLDQFCCAVPCSGFIVSISYTVVQICTALIWLIYKNRLCDATNCSWSNAATGNFIAQMLYLAAAIFHRCMPSNKEASANRRANEAEKKANEAEKREHEAEEKTKEAEKRAAEAEAKISAQTGLEENA